MDATVSKVRVTPLAIPLKEPYYWSKGVHSGVDCMLVEVETDQGITGVGEASGEHSPESVRACIESLAPLVEGRSVFDVQRFLNESYWRGLWGEIRRFAHSPLAGVEMALWDVIGKVCDQPLHRLMGGKVRERINWFGFLQGDDPEKLARDAAMWRDRGFTVIYMKVGRELRRDLACVEAVRKAIGDEPTLRVDANESWDVGTAIRHIKALSTYDLEFVEQPVIFHDLEGLARVREAVDVPIAADQAVFTDYDVLEVIRKGAADVITLGPHETGGLLPLKNAAAVAASAGLPLCRHGVLGESGITTCAMLQVLATIPNLTDGNQVMHQLLENDLVVEALLEFQDGCIEVPDRPGLGVELDRDQVERYARLYREKGPFYGR